MEVCGDVKDLRLSNVDFKQLLGLSENEEEQREGGVSPSSDVMHSSSKHRTPTSYHKVNSG